MQLATVLFSQKLNKYFNSVKIRKSDVEVEVE